jgi:hypothetical protein
LVETARKHGAGEKVENPSPLASYYYPRSIEFQGIDRLNYTKGIRVTVMSDRHKDGRPKTLQLTNL